MSMSTNGQHFPPPCRTKSLGLFGTQGLSVLDTTPLCQRLLARRFSLILLLLYQTAVLSWTHIILFLRHPTKPNLQSPNIPTLPQTWTSRLPSICSWVFPCSPYRLTWSSCRRPLSVLPTLYVPMSGEAWKTPLSEDAFGGEWQSHPPKLFRIRSSRVSMRQR